MSAEKLRDSVRRIWHGLFLEERPTIGLCLFRFFVAFTVGAHIIPTLIPLQDTYLTCSFREKNASFFPIWFLQWIDKSPDAAVYVMVAVFLGSLIFFMAGLFSQASCIVMTASCYYFYALNSLHIGTLSFDILLVTLFLMCVTGYHGDWFSLDSLRKKIPNAHPAPRPFFVQRLLQIQIASTFFYTGLAKVSTSGNWLTDNPMYYLYNSCPESVVKFFPFREILAKNPGACRAIGIGVIASELMLPLLLFIRKTRVFGIALGMVFHVLLLVTLHVPTIFFFLFPPQLLLFVEPEKIAKRWSPANRLAQ